MADDMDARARAWLDRRDSGLGEWFEGEESDERVVTSLAALLRAVRDEERHDCLRRMGWLADTAGIDPAEHFKREFERAGSVATLVERERCAKVADDWTFGPAAFENEHGLEAKTAIGVAHVTLTKLAAAIRGGA